MRLILTVLTGIIVGACSSGKLIIKNDEGKSKIEVGNSIAITKLDQPYEFDKNCASICQSCSPNLDAARGVVDSISESEIYISYGTAFNYDTLKFMQVRSMKKKDRKKDLYKIIRERPGSSFVYRRTLETNNVIIPIDSISMITYSSTLHCNMMAKMKKPFSKPNKLHHIKVEGAKTKVKCK